MKSPNWVKTATLGLIGLGIAGCTSAAGNGALIGGATGAGLGAIIGHNSHGHTAGGALVGGAVGALAGGLIGSEVDRQQAEQRARYDDDRYYNERPYYRREYVCPAPPPRVYYETRTYYNPDGSSTTYTERRYGY